MYKHTKIGYSGSSMGLIPNVPYNVPFLKLKIPLLVASCRHSQKKIWKTNTLVVLLDAACSCILMLPESAHLPATGSLSGSGWLHTFLASSLAWDCWEEVTRVSYPRSLETMYRSRRIHTVEAIRSIIDHEKFLLCVLSGGIPRYSEGYPRF